MRPALALRSLLSACALLTLGLLQTGTALAQANYPDKPVRFIVPYTPDGGTDVIARIVQDRFQALLGQPNIIDNKGGAGGSVGNGSPGHLAESCSSCALARK
jgi:tripartite-type tricarboxylate transporter receptor subunit TctC